jgi:hypothetical protein
MLRKMIKKIPGVTRLTQQLNQMSKLPDRRRFLLEMLPMNSRGVEIGVHTGDFSQKILEIVSPRELHLIDPWKHETSSEYKNALYGGLAKNGQLEMDERYSNVCKRFEKEIQAGIVKIHRDYSTDILNQFPDGYFDWIYIDGNHLYEYVKKDIELSLQKTRVGGYITGDDYADGNWWDGGVKKAVDEFADTERLQLSMIQNGQFVLLKKS